MASEYPAYAEYKKTHLGWLSEIPSHWGGKRLKYLGEAIIGLTYSPNDVVDEAEGTLVLRSSNIQNKKLAFDDNVYVNKEIPEKLVTQKGDILICARNGSRALIGKNAQIDERAAGMSFGAFMSIFRSPYNDYLSKVFNSPLFEYQSGSFLTATINQLTTGNLNSFEIPLPTEKEREKIANFLDHETAKIDTLIEKQQQLIKLLKEKRQAVISHAVTKGLNPNAPMRDSGVEWLGEVPEHWDVLQLRRITHLQQGLQIPQENRFADEGYDRVEYITVKSINAGDSAEHKEYIQSPSERVVCDENDILLARTGATGQVVTNVSGAFHNNFFKVNYDKNKVSKDYLVYFLKVEEVKSHLLMLAGTTTIPDLNHGAFLGTLACLPNFEEQKSICRYLDETLERYNYISQQAQGFVELMQERRTALISAAVTGKIDVRNWQAPEPSDNQNKEVAA